MISIIIPAHNCYGLLDETLDAVSKLADIESGDEIIIVDDKSDNPKKIELIAKKYNSIYLAINKSTNFNRSSAINKGVSFSSNSWVLELDQDKMPVSSDYLSKLKKYINNNDSEKNVFFGHTLNHFPFAIKEKYINKFNLATFNAVVGGNVCYNKKFFNYAGSYDAAFDGDKGFQDFDLFYRMQCQSAQFIYLPTMLTNHLDFHKKNNSIYKRNMKRFLNKHKFIPEVDSL